MTDDDAPKVSKADRGDKVAMTPEQRSLRRTVARALWSAEPGNDKSGDAEATKAAYTESRAAYMLKAAKVLRTLERKGIVITAPASAGKEDDQE